MRLLVLLLFIYHLVESFADIVEVVQLSERTYRQSWTSCCSLNGCFGFGVFVYAQLLVFGEISNCTMESKQKDYLINLWILIEIIGFYCSCLVSLAFLVFHYHKKNNHAGEDENDDGYQRQANLEVQKFTDGKNGILSPEKRV